MSTKERAEAGRGHAAVLAPEPTDLPVVKPNPRGHESGERCREADCGNCHWDVQRLKYWLRGWLLACGADDAEVDRPLGAQTPSVLWRNGSRRYAIEVRSAPVALADAQERTARLRAVGCDEVLWLCPPGYWVARLPALGVDDFAPLVCRYQAVSGMLSAGPADVVRPHEDPWPVREFIEGWVAGELAWGYRDDTTGGWATVADWEQHTRAQALLIAQQRQELVHQRTALALARKATRDKAKQVHKLLHRLERAEQVVEHLDSARRRIADHDRVDATLRVTIAKQREALVHWQLITCFAMLVIVAFIAAGVLLH
ncbi:hypothetical protein [Nocardia pseudobrasiliensis]|uniref:Competence protein CoiA-like protein n=1 Tax=Nocardia pseudobrasiliensis TaxID=45979 RepID=A0A370HK84_9NOCA|nr:hypothetical protein [Nocardia pseudobrasiliensis]RDI59013.1 hypothetical protein DFR76_12012 [Nocardia pseudobrasiliensis]